MCDASDSTVGAVMGQRVDKKPVVIYYASKTLSEAQLNYTTTEKELLAVVYALDKFRSYILGSKVVVYSDHSAITLDGVDDPIEINEKFLDEQLLVVSTAPSYAHYVNYLATGAIPEFWSNKRRQQFMAQVKQYIWDESDHFKVGVDQILRRCVPENEVQEILKHAHSSACGGHFSGSKTGYKGIDFIGPFPNSCGYLYIFVAVDYVSKWVEAAATRTNDHSVTVRVDRKDWLIKLDDALRAYHTDSLSVGVWEGLSFANGNYNEAGELRKLKLNELEEIQDEAYECASNYKETLKRVHDAKIHKRTFEVGLKVWLYNSRLKLYLGKLKSK
ncbi:uncharacterized protein LOC143614516 [Bidens hawaiensis]|uniref:uncharacterized protein LOC143614516 n=1 Tax=Bidens hawaiensis TaxID=980011 RepID=UPI00404A8FA4